MGRYRFPRQAGRSEVVLLVTQVEAPEKPEYNKGNTGASLLGTLNLQPQITRKWSLTKHQLELLICAELGVDKNAVIVNFEIKDTEYDDRFGPDYQFTGVTVTTR